MTGRGMNLAPMASLEPFHFVAPGNSGATEGSSSVT